LKWLSVIFSTICEFDSGGTATLWNSQVFFESYFLGVKIDFFEPKNCNGGIFTSGGMFLTIAGDFVTK